MYYDASLSEYIGYTQNWHFIIMFPFEKLFWQVFPMFKNIHEVVNRSLPTFQLPFTSATSHWLTTVSQGFLFSLAWLKWKITGDHAGWLFQWLSRFLGWWSQLTNMFLRRIERLLSMAFSIKIRRTPVNCPLAQFCVVRHCHPARQKSGSSHPVGEWALRLTLHATACG